MGEEAKPNSNTSEENKQFAENPEVLLERAQTDLEQTRDALLHAQANLQNQVKRHARLVEETRSFAITDLLEQLLPVRDSLELGIKAASEGSDAQALIEGATLTLKSLDDTLAKFGAEIVNPAAGDLFDPHLHEALGTVSAPGATHPTIHQTHQVGYLLNGRLVRPARVIVAQP